MSGEHPKLSNKEGNMTEETTIQRQPPPLPPVQNPSPPTKPPPPQTQPEKRSV